MAIEYLQGKSCTAFFGNLCQCLVIEKIFPDVQTEPPVFQCMVLAQSLGPTEKNLALPSLLQVHFACSRSTWNPSELHVLFCLFTFQMTVHQQTVIQKIVTSQVQDFALLLVELHESAHLSILSRSLWITGFQQGRKTRSE